MVDSMTNLRKTFIAAALFLTLLVGTSWGTFVPGEGTRSASISSNTLTLDLRQAAHFQVPLGANITTFTVSNVPTNVAAAVTVTFTADGTLRTITWPTGTVWGAGIAPTMTSTNNKRDIITLYTTNGGSVWFGFINGQNF